MIKSNFKSYIIDTGVFLDNPSLFNSNLGYLFENAVFVELLRAGFKPQDQLFQVKNKNGTDVDFLIKTETRNILIQVSLSLKDNETREREFKGLKSADITSIEKFVVVLDDKEEHLSEREISVISVEGLGKVLDDK